MLSLLKIVFLVLFLPIYSFPQLIKYRQYKPGEHYKYLLTSESYQSGSLTAKTIAISEHRIIKDGGTLSEEISWLRKKNIVGKDTILMDSIARSVKPYKVSLAPGGKIPLPKLTVPEMVGEITDLNTFLVAASPELNIHKLSDKNKIVINEEILHGEFADSIKIIYGRDCIKTTITLLETAKEFSIVRIDFDPPSTFCLDPLIDTIARRTFKSPNNFQMIQKSENDRVNLLWGVESFSITASIDNNSGMIIKATMENELTLRMRYNSTVNLKEYMAELPVTITRKLSLELLTE